MITGIYIKINRHSLWRNFHDDWRYNHTLSHQNLFSTIATKVGQQFALKPRIAFLETNNPDDPHQVVIMYRGRAEKHIADADYNWVMDQINTAIRTDWLVPLVIPWVWLSRIRSVVRYVLGK